MTINKHYEIIWKAIKIAQENIDQEKWWPIWCIIAKKWKVVFIWNNSQSEDSFDPTAHAEISTIRNFCKEKKYDYVVVMIYMWPLNLVQCAYLQYIEHDLIMSIIVILMKIERNWSGLIRKYWIS